MTTHHIDATILRTYDVRGVIGETLGVRDALALGAAFGTVIARRHGCEVAVGIDGRLSSPALAEALVRGLAGTGMNVTRIGLGPTPMLYYASTVLGAHGAIMVTASHNPADENGFKMLIHDHAIHGDTIQELGRIAVAGAYRIGEGSVSDRAILDEYVDRLLHDHEPGYPLTVAWDTGNGAAGPAVARLTARLPGRHILLNEMVDGTFPVHHPDPTQPASLDQLRAVVRQNDCDLGLAFDGDGDRLAAVDGEGRVLWGDRILLLLAEDLLRACPGATVIGDITASQVLFDEVARLGGRPLMWRTGHSVIKAKIAETGALLAGEASGHIFFSDRYYGYDDALYAAIRLLNLLGRSDHSLAALRDRMPRT
ncbi:MAG TPA: phosphomannomutase/phosphoglucomutase [Stellaceae bacterium]|nr:phosphomannomutase/phosphoglucomutase [Stellaceae bacterium]